MFSNFSYRVSLQNTGISGFLGGSQVGFAGALIRLSEDLLGILDISLEKLLLNSKISGHSAVRPHGSAAHISGVKHWLLIIISTGTFHYFYGYFQNIANY